MRKKKAHSVRRPGVRARSNRIRDLGKLEPKRRNRTTRTRRGALKQGVALPARVAFMDGRIQLVNRDGRALDARTREVRRFLDIVNDLLCDLGGTDNVSTAELHLVARAAFHAMLLERAEADHLSGAQPVDLDTYLPLSKSLVTMFSKLGLRRRAKSVNGKQPSLQDIRSGRARPAVVDADYEDVSDA